MTLERRTFLKLTGAAGLAAAAEGTAAAATRRPADDDLPAVLVDTTRCVGCRACEAACAEVNHLSGPARAGDPDVLDTRRATDSHAFTVVNRASREGADGGERFAKTQCLHCLDPGCASACPVRALEKTPAGPVVYNAERCIGCRYCMIACPFGVPKYEYEKAIPYVRKCSFCAERQAQGLAPACASVCPSGALQFGHRGALLEEANRRIWQSPDRYVHHVYGEHEAGGTSWLYLSDVTFEALGLKDGVAEASYPALTHGALGAVPFVMTLWPPFLMGLYLFAQRREAAAKEDHHG